LVVGGGPAGIASAAEASRQGAATILIERYGFLGGAGTTAGVTNFCGLYMMKQGKPFRTVRGISKEITDALVRAGSAVDPQPSLGGRTAVVPYNTFNYKRAADEMLIQSGVEIRFHCFVIGAVVEDHCITAVITESKSGRQAIKAKFFIDASGDADLAAFSGAPYQKGDEQGFMQTPTMMFLIGGVENEKAEREGVPFIEKIIHDTEKKGLFRFPRHSVIVRPQPIYGTWRANMTRISRMNESIDGTNVEDMSFAEVEGRRQVEMYAKFLKEQVPGFENSYIIESAPEVGIRETRRIIGQYVISQEDVLSGADFPDAIGCNSWPVERHQEDKGIQWAWIRGRGYHQIPYRSLLPKKVRNLLVAGRCISADPMALSSLRVSGPCFAMGQAAGLAAAICRKNQILPGQIDVNHLQELLKRNDVFM
jgi:ribulose 1,5-bisphosphate synthetase/thiazole synthase